MTFDSFAKPAASAMICLEPDRARSTAGISESSATRLQKASLFFLSFFLKSAQLLIV
jgi:hypothetical protein